MSGLTSTMKCERRDCYGVTERRRKILTALKLRGFDTTANLATEFGVSERTIRRDIEALALYEPIYTKSGRYYGGIFLVTTDFHKS